MNFNFRFESVILEREIKVVWFTLAAFMILYFAFAGVSADNSFTYQCTDGILHLKTIRDDSHLFLVDEVTGQGHLLHAYPSDVDDFQDALAVSDDGVIYGIEETVGKPVLVILEKDGSITVIGDTGVTDSISAMSFAPDGTLYALTSGWERLYSLNLSTGEATEIYEFDGGEMNVRDGDLVINAHNELVYVDSRGSVYLFDLDTLAEEIKLGELPDGNYHSTALWGGIYYAMETDDHNFYEFSIDPFGYDLIGTDVGPFDEGDGSTCGTDVGSSVRSETTIFRCQNGRDDDEDGLIDLLDDDCRGFRPALTVIKNVINDNAGELSAPDFTLLVNGPDGSEAEIAGSETGETLTFTQAGAYSVTEPTTEGYVSVLGDDCSGEIAANESATCVVVNDDVETPNEAPTITLNGDETIVVVVGGEFDDPGATATDPEDGDISNDVVVGGDEVDTETEGEYVITYDVRDSDGDSAETVTRTVIVTENRDLDDDGIVNEEDNCVETPNPEQEDADQDGVGDVCDDDIDGDGLLNDEESEGYGTDPYDPDTDGDGLTDGQEVAGSENNNYGNESTDPLDVDSDRDGLTDGEEVNTHGTNPNNFDTDDGSVGDGDEITNGTEPISTPEDDVVENPDPEPTYACGDGVDNDDDGYTDLDDPGCENETDDDETDPEGDGDPEPTYACSDGSDNDDDGLTDLDDPGCENRTDDDETNSVEEPSEPDDDEPTDSGGSGGGGGGAPAGGGGVAGVAPGTILGAPQLPGAGNSGGGVLGEVTSAGGQVLGVSTCGAHFHEYVMNGGRKVNNPTEVSKIQQFLNEHLGLSLESNGVYNSETVTAVNQFQIDNKEEVLSPWGISTPTGHVYKTTLWWLNVEYCVMQGRKSDLAQPTALIEWSKNPNRDERAY